MEEDASVISLNDISLIRTDPIRIIWMEKALQIQSRDDMEILIRQLEQNDEELLAFLGKIGLGISKEHLLENKIFPYDGIFLILDQEDVCSGKTVLVPKSISLRLRFKGSHKEAKVQYQKLLDYIKDNHMRIAGFSREITLIDYGITNDREKYITEICIPIEDI